ncbi:hypothetical protein LDO32_09675 [Luteimonas sp. Y-2-2-4F]|nr:hypothetical protein [Luteimonas sp. Y-2-2-4F]MCD9031989.1 hypothetical protein [Luteimonas sp. Y-2-2-4F]
MEAELQTRLLRLERTQRRLAGWLALASLMLAAAIAALAWLAARPSGGGSLQVSELVVTDPQGVARVRIGGDLPDAIIEGRRVPRGSKAAGVMLYDRSGQERGGYVTWDEGDNIGLTLDGRGGQNALFVAGPDGSAALQLWHGDGLIELRADGDGARLSQSLGQRVLLQQPAIARIGARTCARFRDGLRDEVPEGLDPAQIRGICLRRFAESACATCLDGAS